MAQSYLKMQHMAQSYFKFRELQVQEVIDTAGQNRNALEHILLTNIHISSAQAYSFPMMVSTICLKLIEQNQGNPTYLKSRHKIVNAQAKLQASEQQPDYRNFINLYHI